MATGQFSLYDVFSIINLCGCITAICFLWTQCGPERNLRRGIAQYVIFMIFCLFAFGLYQISSLATPNLFNPWTMKLGVSMFWIKSIVFATKTLKTFDGR